MLARVASEEENQQLWPGLLATFPLWADDVRAQSSHVSDHHPGADPVLTLAI